MIDNNKNNFSETYTNHRLILEDVVRGAVIYYGADKNELDCSIIEKLEQDLNCSIDICESWNSLVVRLGSMPATVKTTVILIDLKLFTIAESSPVEIISMISTLYRLKKFGKVIIGVVSDGVYNSGIIKELHSSDIAGIVPSNNIFGYDKVRDSLREIINGHLHWPREIISSITTNAVKPTKSTNSFNLTPRQTQVLDLVCKRGLSNKKIASTLGISESTVKIHISAILKEYGVRNRTQLALAVSKSLRA